MAERQIVVPKGPMINPQTGYVTFEWLTFFDELANSPSYGLRTVRDDTLGILTGTRTLTKVLTAGSGDLEAAIDAVSANSSSANEFMVSTNKPSVNGVGSAPGNVTTAEATISVSGGTAPYSISWAKVSGDDFTLDSVSSLASDGSFTVDGTASVGENEFKTGLYKATITDNAGSPLTAEITIGFTVSYFNLGGIGSA